MSIIGRATMKLTPADIAFGLCVKERSQFICERCGKQHHYGDRGLNCCHYQGRGAWATRFEPMNCFSLCYGCHRYLDSRKGEFERFFKEKRGVEVFDMVLAKSYNVVLAKTVHRTHGKGEIAAHFREQYNEMLRLRTGGRIGWLPFLGWA